MFLKDLFYPKFCLGCGFLGAYICNSCRKNLYYVEKDVCLYCFSPSLLGLTHPVCKRAYGVDGFMSLFHYNNLLKNIIKNIKYRLAIEVWREFCLNIKPQAFSKVAGIAKLNDKASFIEPIPLHKSKLRLRGFNQAQIIAEYFADILSLETTSSLFRKTNTLPQAQLEKNYDRLQNMKGAFRLNQDAKVFGRNFILVDDVVTTGSTVKEAAKVLKKAGANNVFILSIAHG